MLATTKHCWYVLETKNVFVIVRCEWWYCFKVKIEILSQNGWVNWHSVFIVSYCCKLYDFLHFSSKFDQKIEIRHERRNPSLDVMAASIDITRIKPQFSNLICQKQEMKFPKDIVLAFNMSNSLFWDDTLKYLPDRRRNWLLHELPFFTLLFCLP